jgi:hypothetical protein
MKNLLKLEELGLMILFSFAYFHLFNGSWILFVSLFFVPDLSFIAYLISKNAGTVSYNAFHHKGIMVVLILSGFVLQNNLIIQTGLIFMSHSCFDRAIGYGLKYGDSFDHTHLGWIGKNKHKNLGAS